MLEVGGKDNLREVSSGAASPQDGEVVDGPGCVSRGAEGAGWSVDQNHGCRLKLDFN